MKALSFFPSYPNIPSVKKKKNVERCWLLKVKAECHYNVPLRVILPNYKEPKFSTFLVLSHTQLGLIRRKNYLVVNFGAIQLYEIDPQFQDKLVLSCLPPLIKRTIFLLDISKKFLNILWLFKLECSFLNFAAKDRSLDRSFWKETY